MADIQQELAAADQFDASGRYDEAINALARATTLGSIEATRRLGKRLVTGFNAPALPQEGIRFLVEAHQAGDAEAAARLATLTAAGYVVDRDLSGAIELLGTAAARGWQLARTQLEALGALDPSTGADSNGIDWQNCATTIDVTRWTNAPPGNTLHSDPQVCAFDQLIPAAVCDWLIEIAAGRLRRALVYDSVAGKDFADQSRTNSVAQFDLMDTELLHLLVQLRIAAAAEIPLEQFEATAILHYAPDEESKPHYDFVDPATPDYANELARNGQRIATFLIYLNDQYTGGETAFPKLGISHSGERGQGLMFINALPDGQPDLRTLHSGRPPKSGEKWAVSQFIRDRTVLNTGV